MDIGIIAPVLGVVLAAIVVWVLWRFMRLRGSKSAARLRAPPLTESEAEFLDSSHIISGSRSGTPADPWRSADDKKSPPLDRRP